MRLVVSWCTAALLLLAVGCGDCRGDDADTSSGGDDRGTGGGGGASSEDGREASGGGQTSGGHATGGAGEGGGSLPDEVVECTVAADPAFGAVDVDVVSEIRVTWSASIDAELAAASVRLTRVGEEEELAAEVDVVDEHGVVVRPLASLAFFADYAVHVDEVPRIDTEDACDAEGFVFSTRAPSVVERPLRAAPVDGFAVVDGVGLAVSASLRGVQIYDLTLPEAPVLVDEIATAQSPRDIVVDGDRAYAPAGANGILIFDLAIPAQPVLVAVAGTPGVAQEVVPVTRGDRRYLVVADGPGGVRVLDVTEPEASFTVSWLHPSGTPATDVVGVDVDGDIAAVSQWDQGFALVDLTSLAAPVVLASRPTQAVDATFGAPRHTTDALLNGSTLWLTLASYGVQAFDVTDPTAPAFLDHYIGPQGLCPAYCPDEMSRLVRSGDEVVAISAMTGVVRLGRDEGAITGIATLAAPGRIQAVHPTAELLYVGTQRGLAVFHAAATSEALPIHAEAGGWGLVQGVAVDREHLHATSSSRGLETFTLASALAPTTIGLVTTAGAERDYGLFDVHLHGELLLVGDGRAGLSIFDAADMTSPEPIGATDVPADIIAAMTLEGTGGYACNSNAGMWVLDLADPTAPLRIEVPVTGGCNGIARHGNLLYVGGALGLGVHDVSDPDGPVLLDLVPLPARDGIVDLVLEGDALYAATLDQDYEADFGSFQRLVVFDVSTPDEPQLVHRSRDLHGASEILVRGDKLFVGGRAFGIHVLGLGDPLQPVFEGSIVAPGHARGLSIGGDDHRTLYAALGGAGVGAVDLGRMR